MQRPIDLHDNDNKDLLCRYVRTGVGAPPGHEHTVVLYAKYDDSDKTFGYNPVRVTPCHAACGLPEGGLRFDLRALTAGFVEEDMVKAKAVKTEW